MVQPSHPYMTTGKTMALTRQTFVSKGKSLLFNSLSRLEKGMANHFSNLALIIPVPSVHTSSLQSLSGVRLFPTPWTAACQASLSITNSWSLPKLMSIESVMPSNHLIHLSIRVFSNESALCIRWPKYWSFSFNISPSNEHWSPLGWIGWISSHDSSPTPHFKSISSSVLRFLYSPTLTCIHDYWKKS